MRALIYIADPRAHHEKYMCERMCKREGVCMPLPMICECVEMSDTQQQPTPPLIARGPRQPSLQSITPLSTPTALKNNTKTMIPTSARDEAQAGRGGKSGVSRQSSRECRMPPPLPPCGSTRHCRPCP